MEILVARTTEEIETAYETLVAAAVLGCDTETNSLSARHGKILSVQFSDGDFSVLIPTSEGVSMGRLGGLLENERIIKIFTTPSSISNSCANAVITSQIFTTQ